MTVPGSANPLLLRSAAPTAYQVSRSLRFNSADSAYLSRTPGSAGNRKTWTWSGWVKRSALSSSAQYALFSTNGTSDSTFSYITFFNDTIAITAYTLNYLVTSAVYRDASAWMHIVVALDTTQATASNRLKLYVNGPEVTAFSTDNRSSISQNSDLGINSAISHAIGRQDISGVNYFSGYLANVEFVDGSALTPSSFAETDATTGQWVPKLYSGSYGTNGFKLTFADNSNNTAATLGADTSGNGNHWSPTNLSVTAGAGNDSLTDSPTSYGSGTSGGDVRGNFCTLNPLDVRAAAGTFSSLSNGNLQFNGLAPGGGAAGGIASTIGVSSGKWYSEFTVTATSGGSTEIGIYSASSIYSPGYSANSYSYRQNGNKVNNDTASSYGASYTTNDVIGVALDMDAGTLTFYKNGSTQGQAFSGITGSVFFAVGKSSSAATNEVYCNFGQRAFAYTPPTNFKPLVDTYLPTPTIAKPSTVMDITLYTGNGSARSITGFGFSPDFVWIKNRSNATGHRLLDTVRGATKALISQGTDAEVTESQGLTAFNSDGFSLGTGAFDYNQSGNTYVGWAWDAGTSTVTNTQGSITSQVRANASAGFSICTYTGNGTAGATIGHGLGVAPKLIIIKRRSAAADWNIYTTVIDGSLDFFAFTTAAKSDSAQAVPTSTVFSVSNGGNVNLNNETYVAYAWAPVTGYSSFGVWQHNNSNDGPFIYTGFRPKLILLKNSDNAEQWFMFDSARRTYNLAAGTDTSNLRPNSSGAEGSYSNQATIDFLSNGFKIRTTTPDEIAFGTRSYIYAAWAESPFQYARAR